jgi:hypothetical protein
MPKNNKLTDLMLGKRISKGWKGAVVSIIIFGVLIIGIVMLSSKLFSNDCEDANNNNQNRNESGNLNNCSDGWNNLDKRGKLLYGTLLIIILVLFFYFIFYTEGLIGFLDLFSR